MRRRSALAHLAAALAPGLGLATSCRPAPAATPLAVEYAGCADVLRDGPVCLLAADAAGKPAHLALWLPPPSSGPERAAEPDVRLDGRRLHPRRLPAGEGERLELEVPVAEARLEVRRATAHGDESWALHLAPRPEPEWLRAAYRLMTSGDDGDARRRARDLIAARLPGTPLAIQARALSFLARLPSEEPEEVRLARAMEARRAAGQIFGEAYEASALAHLRIEALELAGAQSVLDAAEAPAWAPTEARLAVEYERAVLARQAGDARTALRQLRDAATRAARLGLADRRATAEHERARLLQDLGRFAEGEALLVQLDRDTPARDLCESQDRVANRGWGRLMAREAGHDLGDPLPFLVVAREEAARGACPEPHRRLNAALNLALAYLQTRDAPAATAELAAARELAATATGEERLWERELDARAAATVGRSSEAEQRYRELSADARRSGYPEAMWRADVGMAGVLGGAGGAARERAIALLSEAEDLVDRRSLAIPWAGRARFAAQRQAGSALRIELLLAAGRTKEAFRAARRSRARVPRELAIETRIERLSGGARERFVRAVGRYRQRRRECDHAGAEDWRLPTDRLAEERSARADRCAGVEAALEAEVAALGLEPERSDAETFRPPAAGELILVYHPLPQGWVAFAADASGVVSHRFTLPGSLPSATRLAALLLDPFGARLRAARRVRILAYGALQEVDFHALSFGGAALVASRPVVYGLDLAVTSPATPAQAERRALVVADPRDDLPRARSEAAAARAALAGAGWSVAALTGGEAGAGRTLDGLGRSDLLHFAGHALAGSADQGGEVLLAGADRLTSAEVLSLERVPPWVVLAGCETGVADREAPSEGLGLAHAFLLRGARQVIAAVRPVPDGATAALFAALYAAGGRDPDLAVLLQRAQMAALAAGHAEAASFRLYEP